jgi:hypothetical protein
LVFNLKRRGKESSDLYTILGVETSGERDREYEEGEGGYFEDCHEKVRKTQRKIVC